MPLTFWRAACLGVAVPVLCILAVAAWQDWREYQLQSFCESVHEGMSVKNMLELQKRYRIDVSLLSPYDREVRRKQTSDPDVKLIGGPVGDPDFTCAIHHNGDLVLSAEMIP
jgi:hypothetical protein